MMMVISIKSKLRMGSAGCGIVNYLHSLELAVDFVLCTQMNNLVIAVGFKQISFKNQVAVDMEQPMVL
jgi:hypothetical protein